MTARSEAPEFPFLPQVDFPPLAGFWDATRQGELAFPRCDACDRWEWYPGWQCGGCGGPLTWARVRPEGEVHGATTVVHSFRAEFRTMVPFQVAIVTPTDAPEVKLVIRVEATGSDVIPGTPVDIAFEPIDDDITMPVAVVRA